MSVQGGAHLQIQGTAAEPVIIGRVSISGGDVILRSNRYELTGGVVQFTNPVRTEPVLNVGATTTISDCTIDIRLEGPLDSALVRVYEKSFEEHVAAHDHQIVFPGRQPTAVDVDL